MGNDSALCECAMFDTPKEAIQWKSRIDRDMASIDSKTSLNATQISSIHERIRSHNARLVEADARLNTSLIELSSTTNQVVGSLKSLHDQNNILVAGRVKNPVSIVALAVTITAMIIGAFTSVHNSMAKGESERSVNSVRIKAIEDSIVDRFDRVMLSLDQLEIEVKGIRHKQIELSEGSKKE